MDASGKLLRHVNAIVSEQITKGYRNLALDHFSFMNKKKVSVRVRTNA